MNIKWDEHSKTDAKRVKCFVWEWNCLCCHVCVFHVTNTIWFRTKTTDPKAGETTTITKNELNVNYPMVHTSSDCISVGCISKSPHITKFFRFYGSCNIQHTMTKPFITIIIIINIPRKMWKPSVLLLQHTKQKYYSYLTRIYAKRLGLGLIACNVHMHRIYTYKYKCNIINVIFIAFGQSNMIHFHVCY